MAQAILAQMKAAPFFVVGIALVWFLLAQPDRDAEVQSIRQQLSFEADLRSQALDFVMEKHQLASVLLARTGIVEDILNSDEPGSDIVDRLGYLQALSGVQSFTVIHRSSGAVYPANPRPASMIADGSWEAGVSQAFYGSLGRGFYVDEANRPVYVFFVPYFKGSQPPPAIIVVGIDLSSVHDSWRLSKNSLALVSSGQRLIISNSVVKPKNAIVVTRDHVTLGATLVASGNPPPVIGNWLLRSVMTGLFLLIATLLVSRQLERRRLTAELAQQRAGEAKRLEREVDDRTRELRAVQDQLVMTEKMALLGQMSASISHEINQPLAAIKNYTVVADRLLDRGNHEGIRKNLNAMRKLTDRISRIVVNLRSFATNEPSPSLRAVNIVPVLQEALSELIDRFPDAAEHSELILGLSNKRLYAIAGETRLLQVMLNLLTNAWFACRDKPQPSVVVTLREQASTITIAVSDNGPGIGGRDAENVFDPFVSTRQKEGGLGLGLTISRSFIESLGGEMTLQSQGEGGATILITLQKPDEQLLSED